MVRANGRARMNWFWLSRSPKVSSAVHVEAPWKWSSLVSSNTKNTSNRTRNCDFFRYWTIPNFIAFMNGYVGAVRWWVMADLIQYRALLLPFSELYAVVRDLFANKNKRLLRTSINKAYKRVILNLFSWTWEFIIISRKMLEQFKEMLW